MKQLSLDDVLVNELGQFGRFQLSNVLLISLPVLACAFNSDYVFAAIALTHRCYIPECDGEYPTYESEWASFAVPNVSGSLSSCERFAPTNVGTPVGTCTAAMFDQNSTIECESYVHQSINSVVYDFGLECKDWLRTLAGTMSAIGTLLALPLTGYISDRWGRRVVLVFGVFNLSLFGVIRAFSINYPMYLVLQLLQTTLGSGVYSSAYILSAELVGPKYRQLMSATCASVFALGQIILGLIAWLDYSWRYFIMILYFPFFILMSYYWILSESFRWLLAKRKYDEAQKLLEKVARVNKKALSEISLDALIHPAEPLGQVTKSQKTGVLKAIWRSPVLLRRVCTVPVWWITMTLVYYGISINATDLSGNIYLNYILVSTVEIPGNYTAVLILDRIGRKATLCIAYFICAICNLIFSFISVDLFILRLCLFLLGKFCISMVSTSLYLYTSELYPTEYRHSLLASGSMIGRLGSISAPLTPALIQYWSGLPSMLFGGMALLSGLLVMTQPETLGTKLPDTLEEAEALGQRKAKSTT